MIELIALWFIVSIVFGIVVGRGIHTMSIGDLPEDDASFAAAADFPFFPHQPLDTLRAR